MILYNTMASSGSLVDLLGQLVGGGLKIPTNQFWANSQRIQDPLSTVIILHACVHLHLPALACHINIIITRIYFDS